MTPDCTVAPGECRIEHGTMERIHERIDKVNGKQNWMLGVGAAGTFFLMYFLNDLSSQLDKIPVLEKKVVKLETKVDAQSATLDRIYNHLADRQKLALANPNP